MEKYSPDQPRASDGRWTDGGIGPLTVSAPLADSDPAQEKPKGTQVACAEDFCIGEGLAATAAIRALIAAGGAAAIAGKLGLSPAMSADCQQEWAAARDRCSELWGDGKLGVDGHRGMGKTYDQCVRGQVSEACGGNPTEKR